MDNLQIWLYVIVGLIYLLSRFFKKSTDQPKDTPDVDPEVNSRRFVPPSDKPITSTQPKAVTFEELLREITQGKTPPSQPPAREEYVNYDEEIPVEKEDLEDVNYNYRQDKVAKEFQAAEQPTFLRSSLEETMKLEDTDITFGKFQAFDTQAQSNPLDRYVSDIYDADSLKKAIVLSEILKTKF
jgi:hypothetical protein